MKVVHRKKSEINIIILIDINLKTAAGVNLTPAVVFRKNVSSKDRGSPSFLRLLILS